MEVKFSHPLKNMAGSLCVGHGVGRGDEEVIHVDDEPSFSNHIMKGVVHESLECSWGITEAEEHDSGLEESFVSDESGLPLMTIFNVDIVVTPTNIKLGEVVSIF